MALAKVVVRIDPVPHMLGFFTAYDRGYFQDAGIDVTLYQFVTAGRPDLHGNPYDQLHAGVVDINSTGITIMHLEAARDRKDFKTVATRGELEPARAQAGWVLLVRKDLYDSGNIRETKDLAGAVFGCPGLAGKPAYPYYLLAKDLKRVGMTLNDLGKIFIHGPRETLDSMKQGHVAAAWIQPAYADEAVAQGVAVTMKADYEVVSCDTPLGVINYSGRFIRERRDVGVAFMKVFLRGIELLHDPDPAEMGRMAEKYLGVSAEVVARLHGTHSWPYVPLGGRLDLDRLERFQQENFELGIVTGTPTPVREWVDLSFVDEATRRP